MSRTNKNTRYKRDETKQKGKQFVLAFSLFQVISIDYVKYFAVQCFVFFIGEQPKLLKYTEIRISR